MPDYKQGKIYQIVSSQCDKVYVGSTTTTLGVRMCQHRAGARLKFKSTSSIILAFDDAHIELVENYPCDTKEQLRHREAEIINTKNCVNKQIPGRTKKECARAYREKHREEAKITRESHKEEYKAYAKQYYQVNKERINHEQREKRASRQAEPPQP